MDRITKSLFEDYTKRSSLEDIAEDDAFEQFVSFCVLTPELAETFDPDDVATGGGNDLGIDAIATVVNGRLVLSPDEVDELVARNRFLEAEFIFIQAKRSANFHAAEIGSFLFGVKDFFADEPKLPQNDAIRDLVTLQRHIYDKSAEMSRGKPTVRLFYATTGRWTNEGATMGRINADLDDLKGTNLFSTVQFKPVDADLLQKLYQRTRNKTSAEFLFTSRVVIPDVRNVEQAYIGIVPGSELLKLIVDDSGEVRKSVFYDNVRDFLDYNDVNNEIKATLRSTEKDRFALLNNGVTVIAKTANAVANKFHIEDFQIVNGCQTSHVLADCKDVALQDVYIPLRLIVASDDNVTNAVIKATNRQTEVKPDQLYALSDFQKKLEAFYATFTGDNRLYYERRSMQYADSDVEKVRVVPIQQQIRVFGSMFLSLAHKGHYGRSLASRVGKDIFAKNHRLEPYYVSAFAYYKLESLFRRRTVDPTYKPARYHLLLLSNHLIARQMFKGSIPLMHSNEMERYCNKLLGVFWDDTGSQGVFSDAVSILAKIRGKRAIERSLTKTEGFTAEVLAAVK